MNFVICLKYSVRLKFCHRILFISINRIYIILIKLFPEQTNTTTHKPYLHRLLQPIPVYIIMTSFGSKPKQ